MRVLPVATPFQRNVVAPPSTIFQTMNPQTFEGAFAEVTDDIPFTWQAQATAFDIPGMSWTPPSSGTWLIISSMEISWNAATNAYFITGIAGGGSMPSYTVRYVRTDDDFPQQGCTITTFGTFATAGAITQRIFSASDSNQSWTVGKRTLTIIQVDPSKIWQVFDTSQVETSTSDFSTTLTGMTFTEGTSLALDGSTALPPGLYLALFGCYAYKNNTTIGGRSEYRPFLAGTELDANLRRALDWESELASLSNSRYPMFIPFIVNIGAGETLDIRWAEPTATHSIATLHRNFALLKVSPIDCKMVGGTTEDSEVTADTYKAVDDLTHLSPGTDDWVGIWSLNMHADETSAPGEALTFGLGLNGTVNPTTERTQYYGDVLGLTDSFINAMGHGRVSIVEGNADLRWKANLTTSRSVLNRTLVLFRPTTAEWPAWYQPNNPLLKM